MDRQKALEMIEELVRAEVEVVHSVNSRRGLSKTAANRERKAVNAVFEALTNTRITDEEFQAISN
jgi:hypothetical protein